MADANLAPCYAGLPGFASSGANSRIFNGRHSKASCAHLSEIEFAFAHLRASNEVQAICHGERMRCVRAAKTRWPMNGLLGKFCTLFTPLFCELRSQSGVKDLQKLHNCPLTGQSVKGVVRSRQIVSHRVL